MREIVKSHKNALLIFALFAILAVAMWARDRKEAEESQGIVEREAEGGSTQSMTFPFHLAESGQEDTGNREVDVEVSPVQRSRGESYEVLDQAVTEWEGIYLGENPSANEVRKPLSLPSEVCDGLVEVSCESSDATVLLTDGTLETDTLDEEGELVELTAKFSFGDYTRIETYNLLVLPPQEGSDEWIARELGKEVEQEEEDTREERKFALPDSVGEYRVIWEKGQSYEWAFFLLLGVAAAFCLERREEYTKKERRKKRMAQLQFEYPRMVDQFAVLLDSGMTIRKAWERILARQQRARRDASPGAKQGENVFLEEMWITYREVREGRGEREAYERFGKRIGLMPYKRFSAILTQNLSKGTQNIKLLLQKESEEALEMRKNQARKRGEEAGSRMLFPMLLMLVLIILVLIVPALTSLRG